jgi:hypothetical protein
VRRPGRVQGGGVGVGAWGRRREAPRPGGREASCRRRRLHGSARQRPPNQAALRLPSGPRSYDSVFVQRSGGRRDGCATFWRAQRLRATHVRRLKFHDYDLSDNVALLVALQPLLQPDAGAGPGAAAAGCGGGGAAVAAAAAAATNGQLNGRAVAGGATEEAAGAAGGGGLWNEEGVGLLVANTHVRGGWLRNAPLPGAAAPWAPAWRSRRNPSPKLACLSHTPSSPRPR